MDKEFKELRDKIGKIWESSTSEEFTDTEIIIPSVKSVDIPKTFKFFQTYGYFKELQFGGEHNFFIVFAGLIGEADTNQPMNYMFLRDSRHLYYPDIIIDLARLDDILSEWYDSSSEEDEDTEALVIFINDLKKVVKIMGGPQKFKIFYDDKNREDNG